MSTRAPQATGVSVIREQSFVDRQEELGFLKTTFEEVITGRGRVVFVAGEPGVGKTRLLQEFGHYATNRNSLFIVGRSYEEESLIPYSAWIEALRNLLQRFPIQSLQKLPPHTASELGRLIPELGGSTKELGIKGWLSGQQRGAFVQQIDVERTSLFQAVTDFLIQVSETKPVIIFFDDVLWADAVSLQLLHYFCRRIGEHRIMVTATFRDVELSKDHPLSRLLLDLHKERILQRLNLSKLTAEYVTQLISNYFGSGEVAPEFSRLIYLRTGGNPFFVEELLHHLAEENKIIKTEKGWDLREVAQLEIPLSVKALIEQKVSRLGDPLQDEITRTLSAAALVGMEFDYDLLKSVAGFPEDHLVDLMDVALQGGFVREQPMGRKVTYIFSDEQVRDHFTEKLSLIRKRRIHAQIAESLEKLYGAEIDQHLEPLAHHYVQAGDVSKAAEYSRLAGERAFKLHAYQEAEKHYRDALDLYEDSQPSTRLEILTRLGDAAQRLGEQKKGIQEFRDAIRLAKELGQNRLTAELYAKLGQFYWYQGGDIEGALANYKQGVAALGDDQDSPEAAAIFQEMARILVITGSVEEGLPWSKKAIEVAKRQNAYEVLSHALQTEALALGHTAENKAEIFRLMEEAVKIAKDHQSEGAIFRAYHNLGTQYAITKADYAQAQRILEDGLKAARDQGQLLWQALALSEISYFTMVPLGEWGKAMDYATQAAKLGVPMGGGMVARSLHALGGMNSLIGRLDLAEEQLQAAYVEGEKSKLIEWIYSPALALGQLYVKKGDLTSAEKYLLRAAEVSAIWVWTLPFEAYFELVALYSSRGEKDKAQHWYDALNSASKKLDEDWAYAYARWAAGILSMSKEDAQNAVEAFTDSNARWKKLNNQYNHARTLLEIGKALAKTGNSDEAATYSHAGNRALENLAAKITERPS